MKWHRPPLAFGEASGINLGMVLRPIFNHGELYGETNLWSCQPNSRCIVHGFTHVLDKLLSFFAENLFPRQCTGLPTQDFFACLHNFQEQNLHL